MENKQVSASIDNGNQSKWIEDQAQRFKGYLKSPLF